MQGSRKCAIASYLFSRFTHRTYALALLIELRIKPLKMKFLDFRKKRFIKILLIKVNKPEYINKINLLILVSSRDRIAENFFINSLHQNSEI